MTVQLCWCPAAREDGYQAEAKQGKLFWQQKMGGLEEGALSKWAQGWKAAKVVGKTKGQGEITRESNWVISKWFPLQ